MIVFLLTNLLYEIQSDFHVIVKGTFVPSLFFLNNLDVHCLSTGVFCCLFYLNSQNTLAEKVLVHFGRLVIKCFGATEQYQAGYRMHKSVPT